MKFLYEFEIKDLENNSHIFAIRKPNRAMSDEAEFFYGIEWSKAVKAGFLSRALLEKRYLNDGGVLSEEEQNRVKNLYTQLYEKQTELQRLSIKRNRSEKEQKQYEDLVNNIAEISKEVQTFEMAQGNIFENTAENFARNKIIFWWILKLAYEKVNDEYVPVFGEGDYEERVKKYDEMEENEDDYIRNMVNRLVYYVGAWYVGRAITKEDFDQLTKMLETSPSKEESEQDNEEPSDDNSQKEKQDEFDL